jgi:dihydrofolate reductase
VRDNIAAEIGALKASPGEDMTVLGSGSVVAQLAAAGLIDEYQLVLSPIALGGGRALFAGLPARLSFKRDSVRAFDNGNVVLTYVPAG